MSITTTTVLDIQKATSAWLCLAVGNKVVLTSNSTTDVFSYQDGSSVVQYELTVSYTDSTKATMTQVARTA